MRNLLLIGVLAFGMSGCAALQKTEQSILSGGVSITAPIQNPVTKKALLQMENGLIVVASGLVTYRRACLANFADKECMNRIGTMQTYTRKLKLLLPQIRLFVKQNDQVNAILLFNQAREAYEALKVEAAAANGAK